MPVPPFNLETDVVKAPPSFDPALPRSGGNDRIENTEQADRSNTSLLTKWLSAVSDRLSRVRQIPSMLVSLVVHALLILALALLTTIPQVGPGSQAHFQLSLAPNSPSAEPNIMQLATGEAPAPPNQFEAIQEASITQTEQLLTTSVPPVELSTGPEVSETTEESLATSISHASKLMIGPTFRSIGIDGRDPTRRRDLALKNGGTLGSEEAVERALEWLAEHQLPDGRWTLVHDKGKCNGRCANNGVDQRFEPAATGLALLAFLGAGYTHREGKHADTVRKGLYYLETIMEETPVGGSFLFQNDRGMYNHGIASFAVCEAYQLTRDKDLEKTAQKAVDFIVTAQNYQGGWGYLPKQPGDLTISGWQLMALKSAHGGKLLVPANTITAAEKFLDTQMDPKGITYGYMRPGNSPTCTAIAMLVRMFRNWPHTDSRLIAGSEFVTSNGVSRDDVYFNYYTTLTLFHMGGPRWEAWNEMAREYLIQTQATGGHEAGSWYFEDKYGKEGGRLYTTAMAAMTLEVYYRFSPLYQQANQDFEY